jgi:hypothetical protein
MSKYCESFRLDLKDIEIIETALRSEIARHGPDASKIKEIHGVLAKIFGQKQFYSQVNQTGVPAG